MNAEIEMMLPIVEVSNNEVVLNQGQTKRRITFLKRKIDEFQLEMEELQAKMKIDFPEVLQQGKIKGKGRPKAKKVEVDEVEADDLFAKLVVANTKNTIATVEASKVRSELYDIEAACDVEKEEACDVEACDVEKEEAVVEVQNNKKKKHVLTEAEKEAKKAALEAEKEAKKLVLEAEKEAKKLVLEGEKEAKRVALEKDKLAKKALLEAEKEEKELKKAALEAEKETKRLALEKDKEAKKAALEAKKAEKAPTEKKAKASKAAKVEAPVVEEAPKKLTVTRITIGDMKYLKSGANVLYNEETKEEVGIYDEETGTIKPLPEDDDAEMVEDDYESESDNE
jgi:hypothetical protein